MTKIKILKAYGDHGKHKEHWNWCQDEPVGIHGMVCDNACPCGCDRAFVGVDSAKSTTLAKVVEVTDPELANIVLRLRNRVLLGWNNSVERAGAAITAFEQMQDALVDFDLGTVLTIHKEANGDFELKAYMGW